MPTFATHHVQFGVFAGVFAIVTVVGFLAARWRRPQNIHTLEEWGLGGRAFGNWVTWFLLSGDTGVPVHGVAVLRVMGKVAYYRIVRQRPSIVRKTA